MIENVFAHLVDQHYASLYRFGLSLAGNPADAGDLVQQTFFIWAAKGHGLRDPAKAKTWLFTTLYREFLHTRRRQSRASSIEDLPPAEREIAADDADVVRRLDGGAVMAALQEVDELFRAPLTLFYLEELSYDEIARALEVPIGTVMSRLYRGKAELRAVLSRVRQQGGKMIEFPNAKGGKRA